MNEFKAKDTPEIKLPESQGFKEIKPQSDITPSDARQYWDDLFQHTQPEGGVYFDDGRASEQLYDAHHITDTSNEHQYWDKTFESTERQETATLPRELTDDEKLKLHETLGWSDNQIAKCTIDENGVIHYKTDRSDLEGKTAENGVPYERQRVEIEGVTVEGVFPKFESAYTTELSPDKYHSNAYAKECNAKLKESVQNDPDLKAQFTDVQLEDIENNRTPTGYVWHHNETPGKMELVKRSDHDRAIGGAAHTGGSALWGPDSVSKTEKGETF